MRFVYGLMAVALLTSGCGGGGTEVKPTASRQTTQPALTVDPADVSACDAFTAALGRSFDLIDKAQKGEKMVPPAVVSIIVRSDVAKAREAAAAASPALSAEIERTAATLNLLATKAARTNQEEPLDITVESAAVLSSAGAALKHCPK